MRPTTTVTCDWCGKTVQKFTKDVNARLNRSGVTKFYCNKKCAASRPKEIVNCGTCGKVIEISQSRKKRSKSGSFFCSKSCAAITNNTLAERRGSLHPKYVNGASTYRANAMKDMCELCGENRYYLLVVHHRNKDRADNCEENWETLCWNCHASRHLIVKNGKLMVRWNMLTTEEAQIMLGKSVTSSNVGCHSV